MQSIITLDLEGVLLPEIWQAMAMHTGIDTFTLTTRDLKDYHELMTLRLKAMRDNGLTLHDIQDVIHTLQPFPGAVEFLSFLRRKTEVIILSDTFVEFFIPFREKLKFPTIFCNSLEVDDKAMITKSIIRMEDGKYHAVKNLQSLNYRVCAAGDSYNDVHMIQHADFGAFFRAPQSIIDEYPTLPFFNDYEALTEFFLDKI